MSTISSSTTSTTAFGVTADTTGALVIQTGATPTTAMTIDASQNVGVGVTPSAWATLLPVQVKNGYIGGLNNRVYVGANNYYDGSNSRYIATDFATRYYQNAGQHTWETAASGTAGNVITFTQSLAVGKGTTLALEGATSATGTGIAFPATQSASSDANTLDDYEEGTWTPTFGGGSSNPTVTYSNQYGYYTKIGNLVYLTFRIGASAYSGGGGALYIKGMPFSVSSQTNNFGVLSLGYANGWTTSAPTYGRYTSGNNFMELYYLSGVTETTVLVGQASAGTQLIMNIVYQAA